MAKPVARAMVYVSGLGLSELYLNSDKVGDHVLSPALTDYSKRVYYVTYDVTPQIRQGDNALGVWLGNGRFYAPRGATPANMTGYGFPKLLLQLVVDYTDGTRDTIVSDGSWKLTTDGPIVANNEFDGEEYDARRELPGWTLAEFDDAGLAAGPSGGRAGRQARRADDEAHPRDRAPQANQGHRAETGRVHLRPRPEHGRLVPAQGRRSGGHDGSAAPRRDAARRTARSTWTTSAARKSRTSTRSRAREPEIYEPRFTYHGFRFVEVTGYPGPARARCA